jgi:hypothetical protein
MAPGRTEIGLPARFADLRLEALILAPPNIRQAPPRRRRRRFAVQVDGDAEPIGDRGSEGPRHFDAVGHRGPGERHEGDHVDGSDARVFACLVLHVDLGHGHGYRPLQGLQDRGRLAGQGQDSPVVARVAGSVEQVGAGHALDGRDQPVHHIEPPALAEVGDRLDELGHASSVCPVALSPGNATSVSWHTNETSRLMLDPIAADSMPRMKEQVWPR